MVVNDGTNKHYVCPLLSIVAPRLHQQQTEEGGTAFLTVPLSRNKELHEKVYT
jgi:hypothetical protein